MDSEFNSYSFETDISGDEIVIGKSERFVFSKKRIYGKLHFLKHPSEKYENDLITLESLRKEFAIGYSLNHPNIVSYLRFENNTLFEEYVDGKSLRELIDGEDPRLNDNRFLQNLCHQFLDVLRYLHEKGVVHNDIKPENVIVNRIGNAMKLIDFNCAQSSDNDVLGGFTLSYKAPEQGNGTFDSSADLYQVGKVMEELSIAGGCQKKWKRFIEGATAFHPANRISLEQAEKLIPGQSKFKKQSLFILSLICICIAAIILFPAKEDDSEKSQETVPLKDTVIIEKIKEPENESILAKPVAPTEDVRKTIDNKILNFVDDYYKENLYPLYLEAVELGGSDYGSEYEDRLQRAVSKAYDYIIVEYAAKLSSQYPEEKSYIERECLKTMEMKISALMLRIYPYSQE